MPRAFKESVSTIVAVTVLVASVASADAGGISKFRSGERAATPRDGRVSVQLESAGRAAVPTNGRKTLKSVDLAARLPGGAISGLSQALGKPDLIIEPRFAGNSGLPNTGYCGPWNGGNQSVYFYVKNVGNNVAPASHVQVNFGGGNASTILVPSLTPNQQTLHSKSIPSDAWGPTQAHPSVNFLVAADHNDAMVETSEANNYGQSSCMGPAS